jgi:xylulokinase
MIKTVVISESGNEIGVARQPTEVLRPRPGFAEQDMAGVWCAAAETIRGALTDVPEPVQFLALTAQGDGCWLVDDGGAPTGDAILWSDGRAAQVIERWQEEGRLEEAYRRNGNLTFAGLGNAILTWLATHDPRRVEQSAAMLSCGGWLFRQLTGDVAVDRSDASAPFLDATSRDYSAELLELFDLSWAERLLPPIRSGAQRCGELTAEAAETLGLPAGLPVVMAPYDIASTAIGAGATGSGQACSILGTTLCTEVVADRLDASGEPAGLSIYLDEGPVLRAEPTLAGTEVLDWAASLLGLDTLGELNELAGQAAVGCRGLTLLPYLSPAGERAPFLDHRARGTFWGLTSTHDRAEVARATFEGLSMVIRHCLEATGGTVTELRLCGGGSQSSLWCQLLADISGVPTVRTADAEAGAKGAFLTGLVSLGHAADLAAAASDHVRVRDTFEPDPARSRQYQEVYADFSALREVARQGWRAHRRALEAVPEEATS